MKEMRGRLFFGFPSGTLDFKKSFLGLRKKVGSDHSSLGLELRRTLFNDLPESCLSLLT